MLSTTFLANLVISSLLYLISSWWTTNRSLPTLTDNAVVGTRHQRRTLVTKAAEIAAVTKEEVLLEFWISLISQVVNKAAQIQNEGEKLTISSRFWLTTNSTLLKDLGSLEKVINQLSIHHSLAYLTSSPVEIPATRERLDYFNNCLQLKITQYHHFTEGIFPKELQLIPLALSYHCFILFYWPGEFRCCRKVFSSGNPQVIII